MIAIIKRGIGPLVVSLAAAATCGTAQASSPLGVWLDQTGRGAVEITDCGGKLCGSIVWVKDAGHKDGCGFQIIGNVKPVGGGKWDNGWIIDPEKDINTKYDVEITPQGDKLKVMGYAGTKFFSQTMMWTRAPANLKKCGETVASAPEPAKAPAPAKTPDNEPPSVYPPPAAKAPAPAPAPARSAEVKPEPPKASERREAPAPAPAAEAPAKKKDCKLEFAGIQVTYPCPQ